VLKERSRLQKVVSELVGAERELAEFKDLVSLAEAESDTSLLDDLRTQLDKLTERVDSMETTRLLGDPVDAMSAFVSFSPGAGGVDSADWAEMLLRMISRYAEKKGYDVHVVEIQENDEGGIKSAMINVVGEFAFGYLKSERGIHRLVRMSPFDAQARRHTSFAAIDVIPEIDANIEIDIRDEDLRIDTYRAGGHGGQHVNKTDSAVRITHMPSGIVVQCQNERSQMKNRSAAMKVLRARLWERARVAQEEKMAALAGEMKEIGFGSQIRSYTLHPSQRVKDHRTDVEIGNAQAVLDGDLDRFMRAYLMQKASHAGERA